MGVEIIALAKDGFEVTASLRHASRWQIEPNQTDLVIEFSSPKGLKRALKWCVEHKKPLVSGTTGISASDYKAIKDAARKIPILHSANMSLGIAVMTAMLEKFRALDGWDFQIDEVHHSQKKDRP